MKSIIKVIVLLFVISATLYAEGFDLKKGTQTFSFKDKNGRNQAVFHSSAPLEDINGFSSDISGSVTFDTENLKSTLTGEIFISTSSLKSGIDLRDEHIRGEKWLNSEVYPTINFKITNVQSVRKINANQIDVSLLGDFTLKGVTKTLQVTVSLTYLEESEATKARFPGDLLRVSTKFNIKLSDYGVQSTLIGQKVADDIEISLNIVGSNKI
jgi:polyisoprenoid-binding protein YceI